MKKASPLTSTLLTHLGAYSDLYAHSLDGEADGSEKAPFAAGTHGALRAAAAAHALNHALKTGRRIMRGNEKLAHAHAEKRDMDPPRDSAFTRPSVLLLLPTRAAALRWLQEYVFPLTPEGTQIENRRSFERYFGLPEGVEDPLASGDWPADHLENFRGNTDDNFLFSIKLTRKAWRIIMPPSTEEKLVGSDIIIGSPLAIKMLHEKERRTDYLSSIEVCIVDGADVMAMQNWDHVQFVFKRLSEPAEAAKPDISRLKLFYADEKAKFLRQTLLLSRYDMPETRGLFHHACHNVAGKMRVDAAAGLKGVLDRVRPGVRQVFERFDAEDRAMGAEAAVEEVDKRLEWFTKKTIPALLRAAGSRTQTLVVVPSYFDYVRVTNHLRKTGAVSYAALSEYSSNSEISRARTQFFKGKRAFLIVTERFHFYRRYRLRGARTLVFYSLPEHAAFYAEFLAMPFVASQGKGAEVDEDVDPADVRAHTLFSRFDVLRLERVVGHADARKMLGSGEARFEFI
jgi:U3 small nucleolar RNA-associated protein 25